MHAVRLLHKHLQLTCPTIHAKRLIALIDAVEVLSEDQHLSITGIGRGFNNHTTAKHNIKRIDRIVGNRFLRTERLDIYKALCTWLLKGHIAPIILIDWSDLTADREQQLLRASVPVGGRSLTIYEEVHPLKQYANRKVHRHFLEQLATLLPLGITPVVVTDAGFRGTWFKLVNQLNWHWIGRIRNRDLICLDKSTNWEPCKTFYQQASQTPRSIGKALLSRAEPNEVMLHIVKKAKKNRVAKSTFGQPVRSARSPKNANREREPWLLATSPSLEHLSTKQVVGIYQKRMQIEEGFRDIKNNRLGLGLSESLTRTAKRLEILLLLGSLALIVLWITGVTAIQQKIHYRFQSNSAQCRSVLSSIFIGRLVMRYDLDRFKKNELLAAFLLLSNELDGAKY